MQPRATASADPWPEPPATDAPARRIVGRAPTRIDFGGGWTDVPPYPERDGGYVCNVAITRHATVELRTPARGAETALPLAAAAFRHAQLTDVAATLTSDFPIGAGLGGSSAAGVALQAAIACLRDEVADPATLATRSRAVEVEEMGIAGGWQDHHAAAFGGALGLDFGATTRAEAIPITDATATAIATRCLLVYTGETRISAENITAVLDAYARRAPRVVAALARMAELARHMAAALARGDLDTLGALVDEHWVHQASLHPAITTPRIDAIVRAAREAGALGVKALGASGGGCVVVIAPDEPDAVARAVAPLGERLAFEVAPHGAMAESAIP